MTSVLMITSDAFTHNASIPAKYTCDGENINPPLRIENIPSTAKSLVLIVEDPDAPAEGWDHWVVWNIPPLGLIKENEIPGIEGINSFNKHGYGGPCPPPGAPHHYHFSVYALDRMLQLDPGAGSGKVKDAMEGSILAHGELTGLYGHAGKSF